MKDTRHDGNHGGMEIFDHDYHFPNTHSREGTVSHTPRGMNKQTKGKVGRGYGGPKALKLHSEPYHDGAKSGSAKGMKKTGNEFRSPRDHKDIPTKQMASGSKVKSTAKSSKKDSVWGGYKGPPQ